MHQFHQSTFRKAQLVGLLERMCESLEPTDAQLALAKQRYEGVGEWLAASEHPLLRSLSIYLQGSTAIGTVVRPIGRTEFDVDLVGFMPEADRPDPAVVKRVIGDRLRENGHYRPLMVEMPRCWRLNYANEFHMDVTPSIRNQACGRGGELVPDKALRDWKESNPKGYRALFERRALLSPSFRVAKSMQFDEGVRADVEPYPERGGFKGVLRRAVQILKRHRDIHFASADACIAPISVIITTLAARSYEWSVGSGVYDTELDLLRTIVEHMPDTIQRVVVEGRPQWVIWNETTTGENFAEKWNSDPRRAEAFFSWHAKVLADIDRLIEARGLDRVGQDLTEAFGTAPARAAMDGLTRQIGDARQAGRLAVAPLVGLTTGTAARATIVRPNTFFGAP